MRRTILILTFAVAFSNPVTAQTMDMNTLSRSIEALAETVKPAVVQIYVTGYALGAGQGSADLLTMQRGGGTGVILDPNGYIVTNAHVVDGARRIQIVLTTPDAVGSPGRSIIQAPGKLVGAQVVGMDRPTDLAVLKISGENLPYLELGDSDELRPGQFVLAVGNPLGLENTVSFGVVGAVARQLQPDDPMIYIQTDAAINPGNSGGPLVDMKGRVMGINTLILSQSGGSEGLGFAAPSNIVKNVYTQIRTTGRMRRGVIGVYAQTITPIMAQALSLPRTWGVILGDVYPGGPARAAGLKPGDIILSLNGKTMENGRQLEVNLYNYRIGDQVTLEVLRGDAVFTVRAPIAEQPDDPDRFASMATERNLVAELGILGIDLSPALAHLFPIIREPSGVVVAARAAVGPYQDLGLLPGDIIHAVNKQPVGDLKELRNAIKQIKQYAPGVLHIERQGQLMYVTFERE